MSFQLAHTRSQSLPYIKELAVADEQDFFRGALLTENASGEYEEADDSGTDFHAVALTRYGKDGEDPYEGTPSFDILGGKGFPPGKMQAIVIEGGLFFSAEFVGDVPEQTGGTFGVTIDNGEWKVDFNDDGASVVRLVSTAWHNEIPAFRGDVPKHRVVVQFE